MFSGVTYLAQIPPSTEPECKDLGNSWLSVQYYEATKSSASRLAGAAIQSFDNVTVVKPTKVNTHCKDQNSYELVRGMMTPFVDPYISADNLDGACDPTAHAPWLRPVTLAGDTSFSADMQRLTVTTMIPCIGKITMSRMTCQAGRAGCSEHGYCVDTKDGCACDAGWGGPQCSYAVVCASDDECGGVQQGSCQDGRCECATGFRGDHCELWGCTDEASCNYAGDCVAGQCVCWSGWTGERCDKQILDAVDRGVEMADA